MHSDEKVFKANKMDKLLTAQRHEELQPDRVLSMLSLKSGDRIGDFGCGNGFFTLPAAECVKPDGMVYAIDNSQQMLEGLGSRTPEGLKANVKHCLATDTTWGCDILSLDKAIISTVLHELEAPAEFIENVAKTIKAGGGLAVIEWIKEDMAAGPPMDIRISEAELAAMLEKVHIKVVMNVRLSDKFYLTIAKKLNEA